MMLWNDADGGLVSSNGELEPEVDDDKIVTEEDRVKALEVKTKANKAFAGESLPRYLIPPCKQPFFAPTTTLCTKLTCPS